MYHSKVEIISQCQKASGMLPSEVYLKLYQAVENISADPILEVGTAIVQQR